MILLVSGATAEVRKHAGHPHLGWLLTPSNGNSIASVLAADCLWSGDNDCYVRLNKSAYVSMLRRIAAAPDRSKFLFVTAPDVVADAGATLIRWRLWQPVLRHYGLPAAFVAQDGQEHLPLPWADMAALFIGGSTAWKEGIHAARLMREAKERGKWVHVGRVNTLRRRWLIDALDADSFDGTCFSKWPNKYLPWMLRTLPYRQHPLPEVLCS